MNDATLKAAEAEAKRFLKSIATWHAAVKDRDHRFILGSKESGAVRRTSMDLTRALADLRRPS